MSMKSKIMTLALGMAALAQYDGIYSGQRRSYVPDSNYKIVKHKTGPLMHYVFEDGFECDAYCDEQAQKKHSKWWKNVGKFKQN